MLLFNLKNLFFILFITSIWANPIFGKTIYVSPLGSDSSVGSKANPYRTIQKAADIAIAGDEVQVLSGIYHEVILVKNSGELNKPIQFRADGNVIVDGSDLVKKWKGIFTVSNKSYITLEGFHFKNSTQAGIFIIEHSNNIIIKNNTTYNTGSSGIGVWDCSDINVLNNVVQKACSKRDAPAQECITFARVKNFEIKNNEVSESGGARIGGEGIDAKESCTNGKISGNKVHDLIKLGIYVDAWNSQESNIEIFNNIVFNCHDGIAIASEDGGLVENVKVYNNICYTNKNHGIIVAAWLKNGQRKDILIYNNTVYNNGTGAWGGGITIEAYVKIDNFIITNNLCYNNLNWQISVQDSAKAKIENNLIYPFKGITGYNEVIGNNSILSDPLFMNVKATDFHISKKSPAVNKGNDSLAPEFDFEGKVRGKKKVDIGALEY